MSAKSDPITVLLWGERWWLPSHKMPIPFPDIGQAADMLAAAWTAKGKRLRLIYQPDDFVSVGADCPNGPRPAIALALAGDHPELAHPGYAWGFEPVRPTADGGHRTLIHFETRPRLFALVHRLEERGLTVESAYPMTTWLSALAPEPIAGGAVSVVALHAERFCFYNRGADGMPASHQGFGVALTTLASHLRATLAVKSPEYLLHVTTDDALLGALEEQLPPSEQRQEGAFHLWDALAKPVSLAFAHPAQLLPAIPRFTPRRLAAAGSILLAGLTLWAGGRWWWAHARWQREEAAHRVAASHDQAELAAFTVRRRQIEALQAETKALSAVKTDYAAALQSLASTLPPGVVWSEVRAEGRSLVIRGWCQATDDVVARWAGAARAVLFNRPTIGADGRFELKGEILPP
jgi:hypothetical protein